MFDSAEAKVLPFTPKQDTGQDNFLAQALATWQNIDASLRQIAEAMAPEKPAKVGTSYVAGRLGLTTTRVAQMAADGTIPGDCIVPGTGNGRLWKFHQDRIDSWLKSR
jgi:hypothetical protein